MEWSEKQLQAINAEGNILVAAAAGSGKTAVLTERIARLVYGGTDIKNMLIVTFTTAAAAEMKKRIGKRLNELALNEEDDKKRQYLIYQAQSVHHAMISTFHSFCMHALRRHFYEAELDPSFRNAEDTEAQILKDEAMELCIEDFTEDNEFIHLYDLLGGEDNLKAVVSKLRETMMSNPNPAVWLDNAVAAYGMNGDELERSECIKQLYNSAKLKLEAAVSYFEQALEALSPDSKAYATVAGEMASIQAASKKENYSELREALNGISYGRISWKGVDEDDKSLADEFRKGGKEIIKSILSELVQKTVEEEAETLNLLYPDMRTLQRFVLAYDEKYKQIKGERNVVDFSDMEHIMLKLLENEDIASEYRRKIRYIFIDEYQDSNLIQETIIDRIKSDDNLFMVGDVKQSIYSFRLADPTLFFDKYYRYGNGDGGTRIDLNANYRSSSAVIETVNRLFENIMTKQTGGIEYNEDAKLIKGRKDEGGSVEFDIAYTGDYDSIDDENDDQAEEKEDITDIEMEAFHAAYRINKLVGTDMEINGEVRKVEYSDIAILLRSVKNIAWIWSQTFTMEGIPVYASVTGGYFDSIEIQVLMSVLRLIDNGRQDVPLMSVLRSPIGGFTIDELVRLKTGTDKKKNIIECVYALKDEQTPCGVKCRRILERLERWREYASHMRVSELISVIIAETRYYDFVGALPNGKQRQANVDALTAKARAYENSMGQGLWGFLSFMEKVSNTAKDGAMQICKANVVRIMSVHKSKGLEFPIVILSMFGKNFNRKSASEKIICDSKIGFGIDCIDEVKKRKIQPVTRTAIRQSLWNKSVAEEMRVLYVALTRARERLIITGNIKKLAKCAAENMKKYFPYKILHVNGCYEWLFNMIMKRSDSNPIRELIGAQTINGDELVKVNIRSWQDGKNGYDKTNEQQFISWSNQARCEDTSDIDERFKNVYAHIEDTLIPSKVSVSSLAADKLRVNMAEAPEFMKADKGTVFAADIGTATHEVMRYISIREHTQESIKGEIEKLVERGLISEGQGKETLTSGIEQFFRCELGKRLINSEKLERELEFNYRIKTSRLDEIKTSSDEYILLQGIIDCCFIENGKWILLDYKTDRQKSGVTIESMANAHKKQVDIYAEALEALTGIAVAQKFIYFVRMGQAVEV